MNRMISGYTRAEMSRPGKVTVLVADDDPALRLLCRVNLELDGYLVLEAASGGEVADVLAREDVNVLLLDVHLGADDGIEIARGLRESRPGLPVALFTGSAERRDTGSDIADGVLTKPFTLAELAETVRGLAGRPADPPA
jgi:CheY-like chemotaxis protein